MRCQLISLLFVMSATHASLAGGNAASTVFSSRAEMNDVGWGIGVPTGPSDYFNVAYDVVPGIANVDDGTLAAGLPITGIAVSVADFGSASTYPIVGVFAANLLVDPSGNTPDLASPVVSISSPALASPALFNYVFFDSPEGVIPPGVPTVHAVAQLPPGDTSLMVGAESIPVRSSGRSGFSDDGYATPAIVLPMYGSVDLGLNPGQDNTTTTSCAPASRAPHGRLRCASAAQSTGAGDGLSLKAAAGDFINLTFFGPQVGDVWRLFVSIDPCLPAVPIGPVITTFADPDGDGSYARVPAVWPANFDCAEIRLSAAWGNRACSSPGVGFTNCVTIITGTDPAFGILDDGAIESGWAVSLPSGPLDFFNNNFGAPPGPVDLFSLSIAVLDFGTIIPAFPAAGVSNANYFLDPTGNTPGLTPATGLLALIAPFSFPAGTFATTSCQYVSVPIFVPGVALAPDVHGWVQFAAGDPGLLGVGADSSTPGGASYFSSDGYASPALSSLGNWGIRIN